MRYNREMTSKQPEFDLRHVDLYDHAPIGYVVLDADTHITQANHTACVMLKTERADLINLPLAHFIAPPDQDGFRRFFARLDAGPQALDLRLQQPDGDPFFARLQGPLGQPGPPQTGWTVLSLTDITEIQLARQAAQRARTFFEHIVDTIHEGLLVLDEKLHIQVANIAFCESFDYQANQLLGKSLFDIGAKEWDSSALHTLLNGLTATGEPIRQYELHQDFPNVGQRAMMLNAHRFQVGYQENAILIAFHDVTHLKQIQHAHAVTEERERIARELHDAVSQTLYSARVITDILTEQFGAQIDTALVEYLDQLRRSIRSAQSEMRMLLVELRPDRMTQGPLAEHLTELGEAFAAMHSFRITFDLDHEFAPPPETKFTLYRIAQEALNNIAKHAQAQHVTLRLRPEALSIDDDGQGFPQDAPQHGQGLQNMRERAEEIGGVLHIESTPGQGTHLTVRLNY